MAELIETKRLLLRCWQNEYAEGLYKTCLGPGEYAIAANHRNNGNATEALMAMLEYMFSQRDTEVAAAWVRSFNKECVRVLEKYHLKALFESIPKIVKTSYVIPF